MLKAGTRIELDTIGQWFPSTPERATVCRWNRRINGERMDGWHLVRFDSDRAQLCVHESRFQVVA